MYGLYERNEGSSLQFLYQQSQKLFADSAVETKRPVPERYLTADTEGLRGNELLLKFGRIIRAAFTPAGSHIFLHI